MKSIQEWCVEITNWRSQKGFKTPCTIGDLPQRNDMLGKLMLVVSEIGEASEAVRKIDYCPTFIDESEKIIYMYNDFEDFLGVKK